MIVFYYTFMSLVAAVITFSLFFTGLGIIVLVAVKDEDFLRDQPKDTRAYIVIIIFTLFISFLLMSGAVGVGYWGYYHFLGPLIEWLAYADASGK